MSILILIFILILRLFDEKNIKFNVNGNCMNRDNNNNKIKIANNKTFLFAQVKFSTL